MYCTLFQNDNICIPQAQTTRRVPIVTDLACVVLIGQLLCDLIGAFQSAFDAESVRQCSAFLQ